MAKRLKRPPKGARVMLINTELMMSVRALLKRHGVTLRWGTFDCGGDQAYVWVEHNEPMVGLLSAVEAVHTALTGPAEFNRQGCINLLRGAAKNAGSPMFA